jgi:hypothetical protein
MLSAGEGVLLPIVALFSLFVCNVIGDNVIVAKDAGIMAGSNKDVKQAIDIKVQNMEELDTFCARLVQAR